MLFDVTVILMIVSVILLRV